MLQPPTDLKGKERELWIKATLRRDAELHPLKIRHEEATFIQVRRGDHLVTEPMTKTTTYVLPTRFTLTK